MDQGFAKSAFPRPARCSQPVPASCRSVPSTLPVLLPAGPDQGPPPPGAPDCSEDPPSELPQSWGPQQVSLCSPLILSFYAPQGCLQSAGVCMHTHVSTTHRGRECSTSSLLRGLAECLPRWLGDHGITQPGDQARAGAPTLTHCAVRGELVRFLASLLVCKIRKVDPTFCKVPPGYINHLHVASEL